MPLYEYQCQSCAHRFELIQKFSDPPVEICPACGGSVRKLLSSPAIQFKGSGWYITDYARKGESSAGPDASKPGSQPEAKPDSTSSSSTSSTTSPGGGTPASSSSSASDTAKS